MNSNAKVTNDNQDKTFHPIVLNRNMSTSISRNVHCGVCRAEHKGDIYKTRTGTVTKRRCCAFNIECGNSVRILVSSYCWSFPCDRGFSGYRLLRPAGADDSSFQWALNASLLSNIFFTKYSPVFR